MKRLFKNIFNTVLISTFAFNATASDMCTDLEVEISAIHAKQDQMKKDDKADSPTLIELKKIRDAQMAQVVALRALKKIRSEYLNFKKEAEVLDVAKLFDTNTAKALKELETHTQAVTKYAVIHSTVSALAKKQAASIAENNKEDNAFVKLFNHLKDGNGKDLFSYVKSACRGKDASVQKECEVFNDFTNNFEMDQGYEDMAKDTINNYGVILQKIYAGSATESDANDFLEAHLEALKDDTVNVALTTTKEGTPSIKINTSGNSLNLLSHNDQLKHYYENTILKLYEETFDHNDDPNIFNTQQGSYASFYLDSGISDQSFSDLSSALTGLKSCRIKIKECDASSDLEKIKNAINDSRAAIGNYNTLESISLYPSEEEKKADENRRDKLKNDIHSFLKNANDKVEALNKTSKNNQNFGQILADNLAELCPGTTGASTTDILYSCVESDLNAESINQKIKEREEALVDVEKQIASIFTTRSMKDLEVLKALNLKTYKLNCRGFKEANISCMPALETGNEGISILTKLSDGIDDKLITEDYSRYFYGEQEPNDYRMTDRYLLEYCHKKKNKRCNGAVVENGANGDDEDNRDDEFSYACRALHVRTCNLKKNSFAKSSVQLESNEYFDWDPVSERMVKRKHRKSFWPQVAMYAAHNSYAFIGPMISTQQLRAQLPGYIYTGRVQQQQLAYQQQYYDWYMNKLDLSNQRMFSGSNSPFYSSYDFYANYGYSF
ncbi:hypothetical protein [Bacteriovorax sp. BAL6_X]|uniref:hypothetical protein n=1 Tax=Bacteriovorax sp. BAL6_X TaxID=1201290 RepID=UPI000590B2E0|nr:hypothetical protein [Bacteriovorax sp. BAL6_X]